MYDIKRESVCVCMCVCVCKTERVKKEEGEKVREVAGRGGVMDLRGLTASGLGFIKGSRSAVPRGLLALSAHSSPSCPAWRP